MKASSSFTRFRGLLPILAICLISSGCLKTRAELRQDDDNPGAAPQPAQVQPVQPQGQYVIDELKNEITRQEGRIEDLERAQNQNNAASTAAANKDEIKKLDARMTELEQTQAQILEAIKKLQNSPAPASIDTGQAFKDGKDQFNDKDYDAAIESFSAYLKSPKGKHAEEATFLRAESYYKTKQYKKAIVDYSKFPEKYTKSHYMSPALYRIGLSFDALGMRDDAKGFYQELVDKFPKSNEAKKARAKLR